MGFVWFWIVAVMVAVYVVLDGFDIGIGILYPFLARNEQDRRVMMRSIGPVWDGNEVWLLAGGGTLYFAFPLLYASAFSGFYLPLMIVLWLLIGRGVGIELRSHVDNPVWRSFFDGILSGPIPTSSCPSGPTGASGPTPASSTGTPSSAAWSPSSRSPSTVPSISPPKPPAI
jgi:cytochrome d oxidase subunit CydB